jgi:hypothetical protein
LFAVLRGITEINVALAAPFTKSLWWRMMIIANASGTGGSAIAATVAPCARCPATGLPKLVGNSS